MTLYYTYRVIQYYGILCYDDIYNTRVFTIIRIRTHSKQLYEKRTYQVAIM